MRALGYAGAQEAHRVGFEREPQRAVIVHHMLGQRHHGQRHFRLGAGVGLVGMLE